MEPTNKLSKLAGSVSLPARWVVAIVTFVGFVFNLALRTSMNIAIVAMVNFTAVPQRATTQSTAGGFNETTMSTAGLLRCDQPRSGASALNDSISSHNRTSAAHVTATGEGTFVWDETAQGIVLGSFYWGYILTQLLGGRLAERFGPKPVLLGSLVTAALATMLIPTAAHLGLGWVIAARILQGICEGPTFPILSLTASRWAIPLERSRMVSFLYVGGNLGSLVAMYLGGLVIPSAGYESIFYIMGVGCFVWAAAYWFLAFDSPGKHPRISGKELSLYPAETACGNKVKHVPWRKILACPGVWAVVICGIFKGWGLSIILMMPIYLKAVLAFDVKSSGIYSSLPAAGKLIFPVVFSCLVDWVLKRKLTTTTRARKFATCVDFFGNSLCFLVVSLVGCNSTAAILCLALAGMLGGGSYPGYLSCVMEMSPTYSGTIGGFASTGFSIGSFVSPLISGVILQGRQNLQQWALLYQLSAALSLATGLVFCLIGTAERQSFDPPAKNSFESSLPEDVVEKPATGDIIDLLEVNANSKSPEDGGLRQSTSGAGKKSPTFSYNNESYALDRAEEEDDDDETDFRKRN